MSDKALYVLAAGIGSTILGYLPTLFGAGDFSIWGVLGAFVGGLGGIFLAYRWLH